MILLDYAVELDHSSSSTNNNHPSISRTYNSVDDGTATARTARISATITTAIIIPKVRVASTAIR